MKNIRFFELKYDDLRQKKLKPWPTEWAKPARPLKERIDSDAMKIIVPGVSWL